MSAELTEFINHPWFDKGKAALKQHFPDTDFYLCPLCRVIFTSYSSEVNGGLTREHVPPEHFGGKRLVLTCHKCNSTAGSGIDKHLFLDEQFRKLGKPGGIAARLSIDDNKNWAWASFECESSANRITIEHNRYDSAVARLDEQMKRSGEGTILKFKFIGGSRRQANLSLLRAAYLLAFAKFGYLYILRKAFEPIRQMIQDPSTALHDDYLIEFNPPAELEDEVQIGLVKSPVWAPAVVAQFGSRLVLLPLFDDDMKLYDRIHEAKALGWNRLKMELWPAPSEPQHLFDFDRPLFEEVLECYTRARAQKRVR